MSDQKFNFFLVCGVITARMAGGNDDEAGISSSAHNALIRTNAANFPLRSIEQAQRALQGTFHRLLGENAPPVEILDVVISSISHLGEMTEAEFSAADAVVDEPVYDK